MLSRRPRSPGADPIVALDIGTSSVRAAFYSARGGLLAPGEISIPYLADYTPDGGATVAADRLVRLIAAALDRLLAAAPRPPAAVGVSSFWHSLVALDAAGAPLTPVLLWADQRSAPELSGLRRQLGPAYHQRTGAPLHTSFWPAKLRWLARCEPGLRPAQLVSFADYLYLRLFGRLATSVSMASATGLWNRRRLSWDAASVAALGLAPRRLPTVSDAPFLGLRPRYGRRWPALAAIPWFPAWGDGACANVGSDALTPATLALTVGTSSALRVVVAAKREFSLPRSLFRYALDARRHVVGAALSEGGNVFAWLRATLRFPSSDPAAIDRRIARAGSAAGLRVEPFFAGERSPGWRPERRAAISGLSLATTPEDIARAALEAVAAQLALCYRDLVAALGAPPRRIFAGGAALAHSRLWRDLVTEALGRQFTPLADPETSARGAAVLAAERLAAARSNRGVAVLV